MDTLLEIRTALREFAKERDWDQFHTPKNLVMALSAEVGELVEHFQWVDPDKIDALMSQEEKKKEVSDEIADVLSYLVRLSDKLDIDIASSFWEKLEKNKEKYPIEKAKGSAKKYTDL